MSFRLTKNPLEVKNITLSLDTVIWNGFRKQTLEQYLLSNYQFIIGEYTYVPIGYPDPYYIRSEDIYGVDCVRLYDTPLSACYCWEDYLRYKHKCYICTFPKYTVYWTKEKLKGENFEELGDTFFGIHNIHKSYRVSPSGVFKKDNKYSLYIHRE